MIDMGLLAEIHSDGKVTRTIVEDLKAKVEPMHDDFIYRKRAAIESARMAADRRRKVQILAKVIGALAALIGSAAAMVGWKP